ncbi:MAG: carboxylating nicotinate-nucleotide diphosphorylase [Candidatus Thermoplasmatota archaeon]
MTKNTIAYFLAEDLGKKGDITSTALFHTEQGTGQIFAKQNCIVAGIREIEKVFRFVRCDFHAQVTDGTAINKGCIVATVSGSALSLLKAERLALNILGRMSGIASATHEVVVQAQRINPHVQIAATRKTTPGFRRYEKNAVEIGGGFPHRYGLFDAIIIKDNHLNISGSLEETVQKIRKKYPKRKIEIEVENPKDALRAAHCGVEIIMLDNFSVQKAAETAKKLRSINPQIFIEISGRITKKNIEKYAPFADRISLGCLTHSIQNKDFSMKIWKK